jgi:serine protease Do
MNINVAAQIVIRHVSGSKANQIEFLPLGDASEITIGRDPASKIVFSAAGDDVVSRRHAIIRVSGEDPVAFRLVDLGSSNGTFLNGERIADEVELLPEDTIEFGKNGPKLIFDVQPRPARMESRTRVMDLDTSNATRIMRAAEAAATVTSGIATTGKLGDTASSEPGKAGVGKNTVLAMLTAERRSVSRSWMSAVAGLAVVVALGGGGFYWKHQIDQVNQEAALARLRQDDFQTRQNGENLRSNLGLSAQDIVQKYGSATVYISMRWRLFDQQTGKPIFHKMIEIDNRLYPAYVKLPGNLGIVRWLTLDDNMRSNLAIGESGSGTGFVVSERGFILTNKHVASAWALRYEETGSADGMGVLFQFQGGPGLWGRIDKAKAQLKSGRGEDGKKLTDEQRAKLVDDIARWTPLTKAQVINVNSSDYREITNWVPQSGGFIFQPNELVADPIGDFNLADPSSNTKRNFAGRNEELEVRFPGSRLSVNANLLRASNESDASLIKVDTPEPLTKLELATEEPKTAERVIVLGYPSVAKASIASSVTIENGQRRVLQDFVPEPYVTEGIISLLSPAVRVENGVTMGGVSGEIMQLSINSTGAGNSGGPVFNRDGKVVGLFTYGIQRGGAVSSGAVPIKYGRDLLQSQHN